MTGVWPELRGARLGQHLQRNEETHTLPAVGPADRHIETVTPWTGLLCAGDWVRHPLPSFFLERAVVTGIAAANEVLKAHSLEAWMLLQPLSKTCFNLYSDRKLFGSCFVERCLKPGLTYSPQA